MHPHRRKELVKSFPAILTLPYFPLLHVTLCQLLLCFMSTCHVHLSPCAQLKTQLTKPTQNNNMNSMSSPPELLRRRRGQINVHLRPTVKHPRGQSVDILGINRADRGRHCEEHAIRCNDSSICRDKIGHKNSNNHNIF